MAGTTALRRQKRTFPRSRLFDPLQTCRNDRASRWSGEIGNLNRWNRAAHLQALNLSD